MAKKDWRDPTAKKNCNGKAAGRGVENSRDDPKANWKDFGGYGGDNGRADSRSTGRTERICPHIFEGMQDKQTSSQVVSVANGSSP